MSSGNPEQDAKRAEAMKKMATMPPDVRARMEAMMKQNGVSMDGSGAIKVCYSKRSLDSGAWTRSESNDGHFLSADCGDMQPIEPKH